MEKMRIAFILANLRGGGVERMTLNLSEEFVHRGYEVDLLVAEAEGEYKDLVPAGVNLIDLKKPRLISCIPDIRKYMSEQKPDAFISAKDYINLTVIFAKLLARSKTNLIVSTRVNISRQLEVLNSRNFKVVAKLVKHFYRFADHVVGVSKGVADDLYKITGIDRKKIHVVYNPVVTEGLLAKAEEEVEHPWFHEEVPVVVTVGRFDKAKDYPTLLNAFRVLQDSKKARLMLVGDGPERSHLESLVEEYKLQDVVDFIGFQSNPYPFMKKADLFVLSSAYEGFGNVVAEALAVGTPVVSTDCPSGPGEILDRGKYGTLVRVGDYIGLSKAIKETLENPLPKEKLLERSLFFTIKNSADSYERLILDKGKE
ncbi:N-acetylgalactosamine-N,N'-diacetylbacillosaminyl-diphospho-undecaprenol 4-alpha-N-acetylgalactosaminyltransferase [Bacillus sp. THAF10]|uniref:glycosyltransferase n=1 Tax=Bacillus sp. THAF10 TaxID=2587848 RepID=UPI0012678CD3|nr:glycosyltransferase [Bacillus sp. THAF10]QFT90671.1 N-acetylgalactosamine-N,N'-diacetylbacillosaminyl-diphospho-undecaprenol 4-alpha-N-acetylgalactosaminyltransferase [Bacillus sp. THAF10]